MLRRELAFFNEALAQKPQLVAANKIDAVTDEALVASLEQQARELGLPLFRISAVAGTGLAALLEAAWPVIRASHPATPPMEPEIREAESEIPNP